jgi:hypothetical protein
MISRVPKTRVLITLSLSVVSIDQYQLPGARVIGETGATVKSHELALSIVIVLLALLNSNPITLFSSRKNIRTSVKLDANAVPSDENEQFDSPSHVSR